MTKATLPQARHWLLKLAVPFFQNVPEVTTELTVRPIAASMIKTYDASVFRDESREAVAMTLKWFREPDIRERLDTWVRINAPDGGVDLPPEAMEAPFDAVGKLWIKGFVLSANEEQASVRLGTIREKAPEVFAYLARVNHQAANIVVINHWTVPTPAQLAAEWDDEAGIRRIARKIALEASTRVWGVGQLGSPPTFTFQSHLLNQLARVVGMHAPHHGPALFDELNLVVQEVAERNAEPLAAPAPVPVAFAPPPDDIGAVLFGE